MDNEFWLVAIVALLIAFPIGTWLSLHRRGRRQRDLTQGPLVPPVP